MKHPSFSILSFLVFAVAAGSVAYGEESLDRVRAEFTRAYVAASATKGDSNSSADSALADSQSLRAYLLYPYLEQARLRRALAASKPDYAAVDRNSETFLKAHADEAVAAELRRVWYADLAARQEWERLLANYRESNDPTIRCHALAAKLALQRFENLQSAAISMWSKAPESRPACEPVFNWLRSQGALTDALTEIRVRVALGAGNAAFARQLIATLPEQVVAEPLETWAALIERPGAAIDAAIAAPKKPIESAALLDGWIRLARGDATTAMQKYRALVRTRSLSPEEASRFALELALALSWNRKAEALDYFARVRPQDFDDRAAEWHARAALWAGNWKHAGSVIESMSPTLRKQTKWRYWEARVAERRGNREKARAEYANLLKDDNYYAALAAARLNRPYTPRPQPFPADEQQLQAIAVQPAFARARELLTIDSAELRNSAYEEWRRGYASLDNSARVHTIALAARWGWYDQAVLTASQQNLFDDYALLYPRPFDTDVRGAADATKLPVELIYATLRQESLYRTDAISSAGAQGLMQLTPDTAKRAARRLPEVRAAIRDPQDLLDPTTNIYLGAGRLRELIDRYEGKIPIALAAYNAGPGAAERWLPKSGMDMDIWIENIPYNETRVYVQRIFWHSVVFGWLASGGEQDTTHWLMDVRIAAR